MLSNLDQDDYQNVHNQQLQRYIENETILQVNEKSKDFNLSCNEFEDIKHI